MNTPQKTKVFRLQNFPFRLSVKKISSSFSNLSKFWKNLSITVAFVLCHNSYAKTYHSLILKTDGSLHAFGQNNFGQGCLLARRLVENKVRFAEVVYGGMGYAQ